MLDVSNVTMLPICMVYHHLSTKLGHHIVRQLLEDTIHALLSAPVQTTSWQYREDSMVRHAVLVWGQCHSVHQQSGLLDLCTCMTNNLGMHPVHSSQTSLM